MIVRINDTDIKFPSTLSDIKLGQRIDFHNQFGDELDKQLLVIAEMEEGPFKELEWAVYNADVACKTFAFFAGIDLDVVQETENLNFIMEVYHSMKALLADDIAVESKEQYEWDKEVWELHIPELKTTSTMTFGELVDSKQILQDLHDLVNGKWDKLARLCAIYLRKRGEEYQKKFAEEDGERVKLMYNLPLDIALSVGFFLSNSMNLFQQLLVSLEVQQPKEVETLPNTLSNGDGLIS